MNCCNRETLKKYIVDACVRIANASGLSDASGVLRGTLFLSLEPMSMDQLVEETGYSKSTVSANMSLLENLGVAKRVIVPGDKRYYYVPITNTEILKTVMLTNLKNEIQMILDALDLTERDLLEHGPCEQSIIDRISSIREFYKQTLKLIDLISRQTMDDLIELLEEHNRSP